MEEIHEYLKDSKEDRNKNVQEINKFYKYSQEKNIPNLKETNQQRPRNRINEEITN